MRHLSIGDDAHPLKLAYLYATYYTVTYRLPTYRYLASPCSPNRPPFKALIWTIEESILKKGVYNFPVFPLKML